MLILYGYHRLPSEKHIVKYFVSSTKYMSDRLDRGDKDDETSTDVNASFSCADCGQQFNSRQELKEHESTQH
jgi:hypothetical protein